MFLFTSKMNHLKKSVRLTIVSKDEGWIGTVEGTLLEPFQRARQIAASTPFPIASKPWTLHPTQLLTWIVFLLAHKLSCLRLL